MIKCGWASIGENGKSTGGKAGDQNGKEVKVGDWYNFGQTFIARFKDRELAKRYSEYFEKVCNNDLVGYNQNERDTLYKELKKVDYDLTRLKKKCNCDCSSLTACVLNAVGIKVNPNFVTANMLNALSSTNKFEILKDKKYITSDKYLETGDIIVAPNKHTITVVSATEKATEVKHTPVAKSFSKDKAGTYVTTADLNMRDGAGTNYNVIKVLQKGTKVKNYGYYTEVKGTKWLLVSVGNLNGFCSEKYLKRA